MRSHVVWHTDCKVNGVPSSCTVWPRAHGGGPPPHRPQGWGSTQWFGASGHSRRESEGVEAALWYLQQQGQAVPSPRTGSSAGACNSSRTGCTLHGGSTWSRLTAPHPPSGGRSPQTSLHPGGPTVVLLAIWYLDARRSAGGEITLTHPESTHQTL